MNEHHSSEFVKRCVAPAIPFGEQVQYLPMKTVHKSKGVAAKKSGAWLGNNERTKEFIIGTPQGVVKCRAYSRMDSDIRWNPDVILSMRGAPSDPVPGRTDSRIPVSIDERGIELGHDDVKAPDRDDVQDEMPGFARKAGQDRLHVSRKAISRYGPTDGCAASTAISFATFASERPCLQSSGRHQLGFTRASETDLGKVQSPGAG